MNPSEPLAEIKFKVQGLVTAGPWLSETPLTLTIELSLRGEANTEDASTLLMTVAKQVQEVAGTELNRLVDALEAK